MEVIAKLIKMQHLYCLEVGNKLEATTSKTGDELEFPYKLSLKNCESIKNGYDLDELSREIFDGKSDYTNIDRCITEGERQGFKKGFQKRNEMLSDKKFSEEDIRSAIHFGQFGECNNKSTTISFIQSLQQTEWEVTFNPDEKDSEGCLILKVVK